MLTFQLDQNLPKISIICAYERIYHENYVTTENLDVIQTKPIWKMGVVFTLALFFCVSATNYTGLFHVQFCCHSYITMFHFNNSGQANSLNLNHLFGTAACYLHNQKPHKHAPLARQRARALVPQLICSTVRYAMGFRGWKTLKVRPYQYQVFVYNIKVCNIGA